MNKTAKALSMVGLLKDFVAVMALIGVLAAVAWFTRPSVSFSAQNCAQFMDRLSAQKGSDLTPAQETHLANCSAP
jgi:Tfp pilus assembly protein PilN